MRCFFFRNSGFFFYTPPFFLKEIFLLCKFFFDDLGWCLCLCPAYSSKKCICLVILMAQALC